MRFVPLIWAALWRKPARAILTLLSVVMAFTLFGLMIGFKASFDHVSSLAREDRIFVNPRFGNLLPESLAERMAHLPGVMHVTAMGFLIGYHKDPHTPAFVIMEDRNLRAVWPELPMTPAQHQDLQKNLNGAFFSHLMAQKMGVKVGDIFPITAPSIPRTDGSQVWPFHVLGLVPDIDTQPAGYAIGNLTYLDQAKASNRNQGVGFRVLIRDPRQGEATVKLIDQSFANSGTPTRSLTEKAAYDTSGSGIDIPFLTESISGAGLFMILFLTGNSIAQSVRERIAEFAVLKTIGFSDRGIVALVVAEAAAPCLLGAVIGFGVARWIASIFSRLMPPGIGIPPPYLPLWILGLALIFAFVVAALSAVLPAARTARLNVATALSGRY